METQPLSITHPLTLELIDASGGTTVVSAELTYDVADPYAVSAQFSVVSSSKSEDSVCWVFARALLATGMYEPVGDGDVHIWPCLNARGEAVTIIELSSPDGEALMQALTTDVCGFLRQTESLVPTGAEATYLDLDDTITKLLP
jgi:Streptomyces sporulation and cell division protein, SsgA